MLRTLIAILLILVGLVAIAGGVWGLSLRATSDVPAELLGAAQTVLEYADGAVSGLDEKIAQWTGNTFTLAGVVNEWTDGAVNLANEASMQVFLMLHAVEVLLGGIVAVETGLLMIKFRG
jgi:hypothetical protein